MMSRTQSPPRSPLSGPDPHQPHAPARKGAAPFPRSWKGAIVVALLAFLIALWFSNSGAIEGTLRSPQAIGLTIAAVGGLIVVGLLLRRMGLPPLPRLLVLLVPAAVLFWLYLLPSFQGGTVVDEALPGAQADEEAAAPADTVSPGPAVQEGGPLVSGAAGDLATEPAQDQPADESGSEQPAAEGPAAEGSPAEDTPAGPVQVTSGTFIGLDGHSAEGAAAIYRLDDGSHIVRLEDTQIQNTPAPVVYLVPGRDASDPGADFVDLGPLKGEVGSANYPIPPDVELDGEWTVLVWCSTFASPIGGATQA